MGMKTSGDTRQSLNKSSRRRAHTVPIFSPPCIGIPMLNASREAIVITIGYVRQRGAKEEQTVGLGGLAGAIPPGYPAGDSDIISLPNQLSDHGALCHGRQDSPVGPGTTN